jgi:basic membrane protein A and related proteins
VRAVLRRHLRLVAVPIVCVVLVAACSDDDDDGAVSTTTAVPVPTVAVVYDAGGLDDGGLNAGVQAAAGRAEAQLDVQVDELQPSSTGDDRAELVGLAAAGAADLVLAVGRDALGPVEEAAADHPDTRFVVVGGGEPEADNVTVLQLREEQAAYLAGAAAALGSPRKHVGFVAGRDDAAARAVEAGYAAGARRIDPDVQIAVDHVAPPGDTADAAAAVALAQAQVDAGADVVLGAPAEVGEAVAEAAAQRGDAKAVLVGADAGTDDPAVQGAVLASGVIDAEAVAFEAISAFLDGGLEPGARPVGAADGAVRYVAGPELPVAVTAQLDELLELLSSGAVTVPTAP